MKLSDENYFTQMELEILEMSSIVYNEVDKSKIDAAIKEKHFAKISFDHVLVIKNAALRNGYFREEDKETFKDEKLDLPMSEEDRKETNDHLQALHELYSKMVKDLAGL